MTDPRFAVVVITWNRREELVGCLGRMTALPERPQTIVTDSGSTGGTTEAVAASRLRDSRRRRHGLGHMRTTGRTRAVEHGLRLLEEPQLTSAARRYIG
jgi:GT2 family glycosyltransferase